MKVIFQKENEVIKYAGKLSDDKLKLFLDAERVGSGTFTRDGLIALLSAHLKAELIDPGVIDSIAHELNKGVKVEGRRIAKGKEAQIGANGKLLLLVKKFTGQGEVSIDTKGKASYSELHLFDNIQKGQIIGRVYHAKPGVDGATATGDKIPAKTGQPFKPNLDKSIQVKKAEKAEEDFDLLIAAEEGYLAEDAGRLTIKTELVVDGDLDFRFGNLDFIGSVVIKGDANRGFSVKAKKGIEVKGGYNGAQLLCAEGDIRIKGVARGSEIGKILSGKDIYMTLAQEVDASAVGNIVIEKQALDCSLRSSGIISLPSGSLAGGHTYAVCGIAADTIGNKAGLQTLLTLCSDVETTREYAKLQADIDSHEKALKLMELHLGPFVTNPQRIEVLKEPHRTKMKQMLLKFTQVKGSKEKLLLKREEMLKGGHSSSIMRVNANKTIFGGVVINAADQVFRIQDQFNGPVSIDYKAEEKKFESGPLQALECVFVSADKKEEKKDGK